MQLQNTVTDFKNQYLTPISNIPLIDTPYVQDKHDLNVSLDVLANNTRYVERLPAIIKEYEGGIILID